MLNLALSLASRGGTAVASCRVGSAVRLPSSAAGAPIYLSASVPNNINNLAHQFLQQASISTTPPLQSDEDTNADNSIKEEEPEKMNMINRWMKWNKRKVYRYQPNRDLIAQIGKGGPSKLDAFRDLVPQEKRATEIVGRSWSAKELRRKSYDDLHKLWYVLYKEKNMLLTESNLARRHGYEVVQPDRRKKVRKSAGAIKQVLGERKRKKIADWRAYMEELERFEGLMADLQLNEQGVVGGGSELEEAMDEEAEKLNISDKA